MFYKTYLRKIFHTNSTIMLSMITFNTSRAQVTLHMIVQRIKYENGI